MGCTIDDASKVCCENCSIEHADLVNCCCDKCCLEFLVNPNNPDRVKICDLLVYRPDDSTAGSYDIRFLTEHAGDIVWMFETPVERDLVLTNVDAFCCGSGEFLKDPNNPDRVKKCKVVTYKPVDTGTSWEIHFLLENGMTIIWSYPTQFDRDEALKKVDEEMNAQVV